MRALHVTACVTALAAASGLARAQPGPPSRPPRPVTSVVAPDGAAPSDLRGRFGSDSAVRLMRSADPDEVLRGIDRAAHTKSADALLVLLRAVEQPSAARADARGLIALARALAVFVDQPKAREALASLVNVPAPPPRGLSGLSGPTGNRAPRDTTDELESAARTELARETAAIALAASGDPKALETLAALARGTGPGQGPAARALLSRPPASLSLVAGGAVTPAWLRFLSQLGDLRVLEVMRSASRASDPSIRAAAFVALGQLGDTRVVESAKTAAAEGDPRVRLAATEYLILVGAPDRNKPLVKLLGDDTTALAALRLAERVPHDDVTREVAKRGKAADRAIAAAAMATLGRHAGPLAVKELVEFVKQPLVASEAAAALARSPSPAALGALEALARSKATRRLAVRAYVARVRVRGETSSALVSAARELAASGDAKERATGLGALVALGKRDLEDALGDRDAGVRRAAAAAALDQAESDPRVGRILLAQWARERDGATRAVMAAGLVTGDPEGRVPTMTLLERAESGAPEGPLAALALAQRGDESDSIVAKVNGMLRSRDPVFRAHTARGLGASSYKDATGRLTQAYAFEADVTVRRVILRALAVRQSEAPARLEALRTAAKLDPDGACRVLAARALAGIPIDAASGAGDEVAWLHVAGPDGVAPPEGVTGALYRADGLAMPFAFDDEGFALLPGTPRGDSRLLLAPRLPAYHAPPHD